MRVILTFIRFARISPIVIVYILAPFLIVRVRRWNSKQPVNVRHARHLFYSSAENVTPFYGVGEDHHCPGTDDEGFFEEDVMSCDNCRDKEKDTDTDVPM